MIFKNDNINYWIDKNESFNDLIKREELLKLSLNKWKDLLVQRYQNVIPTDLLKVLIAKIKHYDTSLNVNSFFVNNNKYWLDKNTRVGLMHLANCSDTDIQIVLKDKILTIPVDIAKNFLQELEVYAGKCYLETQKHLLAVQKLNTFEDIINYDYTKGYPKKIEFTWEQ